MPRRAAACIACLGVLAAAPAAAQALVPAPPGPFVVDLRAATVSLPQDSVFFPATPPGTLIPSRAFGGEVGGHAYLFNLGPARLGVGASLFWTRGTASPQTADTSSAPADPASDILDVVATFTTVAPQLSFNFGTANGWSYLSVGYGQARLKTTILDDAVESGARSSVNVGGGARWFVRDRVAFTFDVRFHRIGAGSVTGGTTSTPGTTLLSTSAGLSLR